MKFKVPDEAQEQLLIRNKIDPKSVCVIHQTEEAVTFMNYNSRDEIQIRECVERRNRRALGL